MERKYLQGNRAELPKTVGRTTLFVREILEKSGQGETYVFDPALLVYLLPAAQEEEETKSEHDEERARDYVLREKETMKLITREEKSREFFTNIIRESTLPGAVEMLWQKSRKEQLASRLQILLREYRELEQRQQIFFEGREMPEQKQYQVWQEFQRELTVLEQQVEIWKQETGTNAKEEHLRRRLEEQVERLFVSSQILEEQEEERLNEVILKVLEEQSELVQTTEQPARMAGQSVQSEEQSAQTVKLLTQTEEQSIETVKQLTQTEEQSAETVKQLTQTEEQLLQTAKQLMQTEEQSVETTQQLIQTEEQSVRTVEQLMQSTELPMQTAELLHRIHRDVLEQAGQLKEASAVQIQTKAQGESQLVQLTRHKIQELTKEEVTEIKRELLYKMSTGESTLALLHEQPLVEEWLNEVILKVLEERSELVQSAEQPARSTGQSGQSEEQSTQTVKQLTQTEEQSAETVKQLIQTEEQSAETVKQLIQTEEQSVETVKQLTQTKEQSAETVKQLTQTEVQSVRTTEQLMQSTELSMQTVELLHRIRRDVLEQAEQLKEDSTALIQTEVQSESQIVQLIRRKMQELTKEEATEMKRELLYKRSEATDTPSLLYEQPSTEKWLNEMLLKVLEERSELVQSAEQPARIAGQSVQREEQSTETVKQLTQTEGQLLQTAKQLMQTEEQSVRTLEQLMQSNEEPLQPMELLHRSHKDGLEQTGQLRESSADGIQTEAQNESQLVQLIRHEMKNLSKEEAAEMRRELLHKRSQGQSQSELHTEELLYQIREHCLEKVVQEVRKEEANLVSTEEKLRMPEFIYKIIKESLKPEQRVQLHTEEMERLYREKREQVRQIFTQENRLEQLIYQNAETAEAPQQILPEVKLQTPETEDTLSWQQLAARPEIRELIENREIRVPGEQRGAEGQLKYYQNHVEKVEQLREEQQEQFKNLMERAALQEEQIIRIENWQQEIKERLREQEERQTVPERDEQVFKKFQEQLRMERLRRGLI